MLLELGVQRDVRQGAYLLSTITFQHIFAYKIISIHIQMHQEAYSIVYETICKRWFEAPMSCLGIGPQVSGSHGCQSVVL